MMDMNMIFQENMCLTDLNHSKHSKMTIFGVHFITGKHLGTVFGGVQSVACESKLQKWVKKPANWERFSHSSAFN